MRVSTRLATSSGLVFLLLTGVLAYEVGQVNRLARLSGGLARSGLAAAELSIEQIADLGDLEAGAKKAFVTRDPDYSIRVRDLADRVSSRQEKMASLGLSEGVRTQWDLFGTAWRPVRLAIPGFVTGKVVENEFLGSLGRAQAQALALATATRVAIREDAARAQSSADRASVLSLAAASMALLVGAVALTLTVRSIQRPLTRLARGTRAVAQGHFDELIEIRGGDEFALLAADFNQMVKKLGELDQMKKDLLSHVSHELKAPLAAMQETNQLLLEGIPGPVTEDQRRLIGLNLQSARRLSALIAKLLDLSRMEAGVMDYDLRPHDLSPVLRGACGEMQALAGERGVALRLSLPPHPLWIFGDADRLYQVVANLLENAIKFSPRGSEVRLAASLAEDLPPHTPERVRPSLAWDPSGKEAVLVSVSDSGPGIPADQRDKIFERFHQVPRGRGREGGGVGLGLAICREIVSAHGGAIWVANSDGQGSLFTVALAPLPSADPPVAEPPSPS